MDPLQIESVLEALTALDWVGRLDEEGQPRYVLLCDPAHTPLAPLVDVLLLAPIDALAPARGKLGVGGIQCRRCCRSSTPRGALHAQAACTTTISACTTAGVGFEIECGTSTT